VEFVVDKMASGQVFSEYFGSPAKTDHFTNFSILTITLLHVQIGQKWPQCRVDPVWTPSPATSRKVTGSSPDEEDFFFNLPNPSSRIMTLGRRLSLEQK
jgi:hypothetical protein